MNLSLEKYEIIEYDKGPIRVVAGPGSGKTRTIVEKIKKIALNDKVPENEILVITFTNKAVKEVKSRLSEYDLHKVNVMTYHAFCRRVISLVGGIYGFDKWKQIDYFTQLGIIDGIIKNDKINTENFTTKEILSEIDLIENGCSVEVSGLSRKVNEFYKSEKAKRRLLDLNDLISKTHFIFSQRKDVSEKFSEIFKYVFIDEFQDTNKIQYEIIKLFNKQDSNLMIVGDVDQNIYSWRGADAEYMINFEKDYPRVKTFYLKDNYRSGTKIVDVAKKMIKNNDGRFEEFEMKAGNSERGKVFEKEYNDQMHESNTIAKIIKSKLNDGENPEEIAIIVRNSFYTRSIESALTFNNIPYKMIGAKNFFNRKEIQRLLVTLEVLNQPTKSNIVQAMRNLPTNIREVEIRKINDSTLDLFKDDIEQLSNRAKELLALIKEVNFNDWKEKKIDALQKFVNESGCFEYDERRHSVELGNIKEFMSMFSDKEESGNEDNGWISEILSNLNDGEMEEESTDDGKISILTAHASKGTEYEIVFIPSFIEGHWPSKQSIAIDDVSEERRVAYVGITRAKMELYISHYNDEKSRFLSEMNGEKFMKDSGNLPCEACGIGKIVKRTSKFGGEFYGCDQFPRCKEILPTNVYWERYKEYKEYLSEE